MMRQTVTIAIQACLIVFDDALEKVADAHTDHERRDDC